MLLYKRKENDTAPLAQRILIFLKMVVVIIFIPLVLKAFIYSAAINLRRAGNTMVSV